MVHVGLAALAAAFYPLSPVTFRFDRLETNPRFATIARPANAVIVVPLRVDMEDRGGLIELLIPYATLETVRALLQLGRAACRGRVCQTVWISVVAVSLKKTDQTRHKVNTQETPKK